MKTAASEVADQGIGIPARTAFDTKRRLLWHGMFLFLLGLLTGFVEQNFSNPRMGLAAHLEGVMNGTFLIAVGAIWTEVHLSPRLQGAAYWSTLYATYANWAVTTLAAVFGTGAMSPITAAGRSGLLWQERLVTAGFVSVGIVVVVASILILSGLRRTATSRSLSRTAGKDPAGRSIRRRDTPCS